MRQSGSATFGFAVAALGLAAAIAFLFVVLEPADAKEACFATVFLGLVAGAAVAPFLGPPARTQFAICLGIGLATAAIALFAARGGHGLWWRAVLAGWFCALFALAASHGGAVMERLLPGRLGPILVAGCALALLFTLHVWDDAVFDGVTDRKGSASLAFALNPAAAASVTLEFDWIHATELYRHNETAESMAGVPRAGLGSYAWKTAMIALVAGAIAMILERRRRGGRV
ncbi:MAG: hypothetical protein V3T86_01980 [Planctomycetota bacterium]